MIRAFSVIYGSEIFLVLKDIWKMDDAQVTQLTQWIQSGYEPSSC